jgi:hypothetical protein
MALVDLRHSTVKLKNAAPSELIVKIGEGTLSFTEHHPVEYLIDSGNLDEVRRGKPMPLDVKLDAMWIAVGSSATTHVTANDGTVTNTTSTWSSNKIMDILKGPLSASTDTDLTRPYACDLEVVYMDADGTSTTTVLLEHFRYESADFDLQAGTISLTGKCFTTIPTITTA